MEPDHPHSDIIYIVSAIPNVHSRYEKKCHQPKENPTRELSGNAT